MKKRGRRRRVMMRRRRRKKEEVDNLNDDDDVKWIRRWRVMRRAGWEKGESGHDEEKKRCGGETVTVGRPP